VNKLLYIPALDSLRGIAVLLVLFEHFFLPLLPSAYHLLPAGALGVCLFFVLSGFLISTTLFEATQNNENCWAVLRNFYVKRGLRLFPIYYLTLVAGILFFPVLNLQEHALYYFTYTTNFQIFNAQVWGKAGHFWSLAIEEQFYLFWPFVLLFVPRPCLKIVIICFIIAAPLFKIWAYLAFPHKQWHWLLTPFNFDLLGAGAFLAYVRYYETNTWEKLLQFQHKRTLAIVCIACLLILSYILNINYLAYSMSFYLCLAILVIIWIIAAFLPQIPVYLHNRWLQALGKISYGIYVYHLIIAGLWGFNSRWFMTKGIDYEWIYWFDNSFVAALSCFLVTIVVSLLSYWFLEKPINIFRHSFFLKIRNY
jgi:peptidoglycan/LPS O-acetylase OafA/YrhL